MIVTIRTGPHSQAQGELAAPIETCDKYHRPLRVGDVLKVFHFVGARRKKHYMYKQITRTQWLGGYGGRPKVLYFYVSHLNLKPPTDTDGGYWLGMFEGVLGSYEIIQCPTANHEERSKVNATIRIGDQEITGELIGETND